MNSIVDSAISYYRPSLPRKCPVYHPRWPMSPIVILYPGTPGAPSFDGQNITDFLDRYSQLCSDYRLSELEKNQLPPMVL